MKKYLLAIFLIFLSCYGVFRTAEPLEEGEWMIDVNMMNFKNEMGKYKYDSPCVIVRRGFKRDTDLGLKFFFMGWEFMIFKNLINEKRIKFFPSVGIQMGFGIPLFELEIITSKNFGILTPYFSYRFWGFYSGPYLEGFNMGIQLFIHESFYKKDNFEKSKLFIMVEYYKGEIYEQDNIFYSPAIGGGFKIYFSSF